MPSEQLTVLKLVAETLDGAGLPYMLSGSTAMNYYAQPRMTRDIDLVVELSADDAPRFTHLFGAAFYLDDDAVADAIARQGMFNLIHTALVIKVDFIVRKGTAYRREEFSRRRRIRVDDFDLWIVTAEDLVLSKLDWARDSRSELQLADVRNLTTAVADLDWSYLERWAAVLGVTELLREVRS
ncbi:MAG: hypothetical protein FJ144_11745 [Deltaproteobacteria bacterium]|nr:hypothetical protein [Deltaproteobacteria bacterium]